jgi:hypothetical protein
MDVAGGEQGGRAMPEVIVGHRPGASALHRQARLGAVKSLELALLVDREHQAVRRRVEVEPDHIAQLVEELRCLDNDRCHAILRERWEF